MAKKAKTVFVCQECGYESPKWLGQCICGAWNTMVEEKVMQPSKNAGHAPGRKAHPSPLNDVKREVDGARMDTGIGELNRVLGGGLVRGSLTLISGEPGIGKSTIIMQAAMNIAAKYGKVLYVSGEESKEQIGMRADRLPGDIDDNLFILTETDIDNVRIIADEMKPEFLIIDSIQTMYTEDLDSAPGSVSQVRASGSELMKIGKEQNIPVFIVAHVTKSGDLAGPKIIEHLVDCVLNFGGERGQELRILRSFKNRFGTTSEIGAFEMTGQGLIEVEDLSKRFLEDFENAREGSVVTAVYEGTRPLLFEIQALTSPANVGFARRTALGIDNGRLNMILAVLERKAGLSMSDQDVYVNVVGGLKPEGTSTDLAVALAVHSAHVGIAAPKDMLALGEIGLTGELRAAANAERIVKEARRMGFKRIILHAEQAKKISAQAMDLGAQGMEIIGVSNVNEAIRTYRSY